MNKPSKYPSVTDYKHAIIDSDSFATLKNIEVQYKGNGDIHYATGNFAVVFKVKVDSKFYALKCFLTPLEDREERYSAISEYLIELKSPYFVNYSFLPNEIWANDCEFPILLMEWVEGETLGEVVKEYCNKENTKGIATLINKFKSFAENFAKLDLAHGDLKHDNILIDKNGDLLLVDYDGMYVPKLKEKKAIELGSKAYQHPHRSIDNFDSEIDFFSILVILTSLNLLHHKPFLYEQFNNGQNLILTQNDFDDFESSSIYSELIKIEELFSFVEVWTYIDWLSFDEITDFKEQFLLKSELDLIYQENEKGIKARCEWLNSLSEDWLFALKLSRKHQNKILNFILGDEDSTDTRILEVINSLTSISLSLINSFEKRHKKESQNYFFVVNLKPLIELTKLTEININYGYFKNSNMLNDLSSLTWIKKLIISRLEDVKDLSFLPNSKKMTHLELHGIGNVDEKEKIGNYTNLKTLVLCYQYEPGDVSYMDIIYQHIYKRKQNKFPKKNRSLEYIKSLKKIENLTILKGINIDDLSVLSNFPKLKSLTLTNFYSLKNFDFFESLTQLKSLSLISMSIPSEIEFNKIKLLNNLIELRLIYIFENDKNINISILNELIGLESFNFYDDRIFSIRLIENLKRLKRLTLHQFRVKDVNLIYHFDNLNFLELNSKIIKIEKIVSSEKLYISDSRHMWNYYRCYY